MNQYEGKALTAVSFDKDQEALESSEKDLSKVKTAAPTSEEFSASPLEKLRENIQACSKMHKEINFLSREIRDLVKKLK